jgi:DedD protein
MDRRVKERLVGASILVALIVLIVPELLSGPTPSPVIARLPVSTPEPVRNVTVDLVPSKVPAPAAEPAESPSGTPGGKAAGGDAASGNAASGNAAGGNAAGGDAAGGGAASAGATSAGAASGGTASASAAPSVALETAPPPPTSAAAASKPAVASRAWAVQLGSFASRDNADKLLRQLRAQGFSVFILPGGSGPSLRYRVRIGPMADRGAAAQEAARLKSLGHAASVVPPAP